jgi:hypothetical protein
MDLDRPHLRLFLAIWLAFTGLTFAIVSRGLDRADRSPARIAATTAATLLGPLVGAVSRDFQGCCVAASLALVPYGLAALGAAVLLQFVPPGTADRARVLRLLAWAAGWIAWFGLGIVSFAHALS